MKALGDSFNLFIQIIVGRSCHCEIIKTFWLNSHKNIIYSCSRLNCFMSESYKCKIHSDQNASRQHSLRNRCGFVSRCKSYLTRWSIEPRYKRVQTRCSIVYRCNNWKTRCGFVARRHNRKTREGIAARRHSLRTRWRIVVRLHIRRTS